MARDGNAYFSIPISFVSGLEAVRFYEETRAHIWNNHPEISRIFVGLPSFDVALTEALMRPDSILRSRRRSLVFVKHATTNWTGQPLCVPVKLIGNGRPGYVKTAYFGNFRAHGGAVYERGRFDG